MLWQYQARGGFEAVLAELQEKPDARLEKFQEAMRLMFGDMNRAFEGVEFEYSVTKFLTRFNAIFTLNQDLLLERKYHNDNVSLLSSDPKWDGGGVPGMTKHSGGTWTPQSVPAEISPRIQPYFKLHGSSNWIDKDLNRLIVLGGNKQRTIGRFPILNWYYEHFEEYLSRPDTRLVIIGYGFADAHINRTIEKSASSNSQRIFIVDSLGVDVIDERRNVRNMGGIYEPTEFTKSVRQRIFGASRRGLRHTLEADVAERLKIERFLDL